MQIATAVHFFFLLTWASFLHPTTQDLVPAPSPVTGSDAGRKPAHGPATFSSPSPAWSGWPAPVPEVEVGRHSRANMAPAPALDGGGEGVPPPLPAAMVEETESGTVSWCAVRDEFEDCQNYISLLKQTDGYTWKCVQRGTTQECLDSIESGEADLINLDPGLAYIAFLNYSMKAIANEVYCNHAESYNSVAVVNRKACEENHRISLQDFKGHKSCHGGYSTAMGWNYPINYLKKFVNSNRSSEREIVSGFFSSICAPSEFEGMGECSGCGNGNTSCSPMYYGHSGAFRCLVEELGDIAFVKEDTALLYSLEGPYNKTWSTKSINEFMYLCPQGGCREINGYPGDCIFGTIPANVIMTHNSISSKKRLAMLQTLLNATWDDDLYSGKNGDGHVLSSSTQGLTAVKKLTRAYLGLSASISQAIQELNVKEVHDTPSTDNPVLDASSATLQVLQQLWPAAMFSILHVIL